MSATAALASAAERYATCGRGVAWSARIKLRLDPVYAALVESGLARAGRVIDLGCGRGLALAVALEASGRETPRSTLFGIERSRAALAIARRALGSHASIVEADLAEAEIPRADTALLIDVLHYLRWAEQDALLDRVRGALAPGGRVLVREVDAGAGPGFVAVCISERLMSLARGEGVRPFAYRSAQGWRDALTRRGLDVELTPMGAGTPFANVLLVGRAPA